MSFSHEETILVKHLLKIPSAASQRSQDSQPAIQKDKK